MVFSFILNEDKFFKYHDDFEVWIPNLSLLTNNRKKIDIFYLSSNILHLISVHERRFNMVPIANSENSLKIELNHVKNYL